MWILQCDIISMRTATLYCATYVFLRVMQLAHTPMYSLHTGILSLPQRMRSSIQIDASSIKRTRAGACALLLTFASHYPVSIPWAHTKQHYNTCLRIIIIPQLCHDQTRRTTSLLQPEPSHFCWPLPPPSKTRSPASYINCWNSLTAMPRRHSPMRSYTLNTRGTRGR